MSPGTVPLSPSGPVSKGDTPRLIWQIHPLQVGAKPTSIGVQAITHAVRRARTQAAETAELTKGLPAGSRAGGGRHSGRAADRPPRRLLARSTQDVPAGLRGPAGQIQELGRQGG